MSPKEENELCDHAYLCPVNLGEYVECEICGFIFLRKYWGTFSGDEIPKTQETISYGNLPDKR